MSVNNNIYVQVWTEIDPTLNVRVDRSSGDAVAEDGDLLRRVSPLGRAAVAAAQAMNPASITAFSVGLGHFDALRHALAAGASQAVELTIASETPNTTRTHEPGTVRDAWFAIPLSVARWLDGSGANLVIAGRAAGSIAGWLGWAHLAGRGPYNSTTVDCRRFAILAAEHGRSCGRCCPPWSDCRPNRFGPLSGVTEHGLTLPPARCV
jgi:hypothetical protein